MNGIRRFSFSGDESNAISTLISRAQCLPVLTTEPIFFK